MTPFATSTFRIELTSVVLPTPGPPVITRTLLATARRRASRWLGARVRPPRLFQPRDGLVDGEGRATAAAPRTRDCSRSAMSRSARYRPARKTQRRSPRVSATTAPSCEFEGQRGGEPVGRHLQQLAACAQQIVLGQAAVALVHRLGQGVADAGADPHHGVLGDAELRRDLVGRLEADAADVARQAGTGSR